MSTNDVHVISVDDHVVEYPTVWQDRLSNKFKDAGPRNARRFFNFPRNS